MTFSIFSPYPKSIKVSSNTHTHDNNGSPIFRHVICLDLCGSFSQNDDEKEINPIGDVGGKPMEYPKSLRGSCDLKRNKNPVSLLKHTVDAQKNTSALNNKLSKHLKRCTSTCSTTKVTNIPRQPCFTAVRKTKNNFSKMLDHDERESRFASITDCPKLDLNSQFETIEEDESCVWS
uniref:Uncharacterized protein n=1 Tax=Corethron hystrix TaxID=216773 RepID=A0A7S1FRN3_9STRA|mmetsp:Transcript_23300/g.53208  ORF Transcript_23300/g.53208 Transcript_23300/m.53208 type:complete len:177 (+) Transcript_23300:151-681(+)